MNSLFSNLSAQELRRAAEIREKIDDLEDELRTILGGVVGSQRGTSWKGKRRMSAAGRAAIAAGAKARWARTRGNSHPGKARMLGKRKMSPAARARLSAIAKARWKRAKAAGKSAL